MDPLSMISAYIAEDLTEEDVLYFESAVRQDPVLQRKLLEAYEFEQLLKRTLIQQAFEKLTMGKELSLEKKILVASSKEEDQIIPLISTNEKSPARWMWLTRVAAVGLMLLAVFLYDHLLIGPDPGIKEWNANLSESVQQEQLKQERSLKDAIATNPSDGELVKALANFYLAQGDREQAQKLLERLLDFRELDPKAPNPENTRQNLKEFAEYKLMLLHLANRDMKESKFYTQQILKNPKHDHFESAQDLVQAKKQNFFWLILGGCVLLLFSPKVIRYFHKA